MIKLALTTALPFLVLVTWPEASHAEGEVSGTLRIAETISLDFVPEQAFFVVRGEDGTAWRYEGVLVPLSGDSSGKEARAEWFVGAEVAIAPAVRSIGYGALIVGPESRYAFIAPQTKQISSSDIPVQESELLRSEIKDTRVELAGYRKDIATFTERLRRLQADADTIAGFERVRATQDNKADIVGQIEGLKLDIQNLQHNIEMVKEYPAPQNYLLRERELTGQLAELAEAAKQAETRELSRRSANEMELQLQLRLIDETRFYDAEDLERELAELTEERRRLEGSMPISADPGAGSVQRREQLIPRHTTRDRNPYKAP